MARRAFPADDRRGRQRRLPGIRVPVVRCVRSEPVSGVGSHNSVTVRRDDGRLRRQARAGAARAAAPGGNFTGFRAAYSGFPTPWGVKPGAWSLVPAFLTLYPLIPYPARAHEADGREGAYFPSTMRPLRVFAAGRPGRKSATMSGRAGNRRRMPRSGASRRPAAALPLYAHLPAASPRHRPAAMKRIFARSRCRERPPPAALCTGLGATFVRLR
jgi:hypothetical protein